MITIRNNIIMIMIMVIKKIRKVIKIWATSVAGYVDLKGRFESCCIDLTFERLAHCHAMLFQSMAQFVAFIFCYLPIEL